MTTLNLQVGASADDTCVFGGTFYNTLADVGNAFSTITHVAERFTGVSIAQAATINSATLSVRAKENQSGATCNLKVFCDDSDNATAPTNATTFNGKTLTTGTSWSSVPSFTLDTWYSAPDIATEVQAVINRSGWVSGNALQTFIKNNASSSNAYRALYDYSDSSANAPKLDITYTAGGGGTTVKTLAATGVGG